MAKNRNLFRLTRLVLLKLPRLFRLFAKLRKPEKRLLIIKTDAIGDYILFRNFISIVNHSEKYKGYEIHLMGNKLWKEIVLNYDINYINKVFLINPDDLYYSPLKTLKLGWHLFRKNYLVVLHPTHARTLIADGLAGLTAAKQIIGFDGDNQRILAKYKVKTDKFYTERLYHPESLSFEFDRSKFFFETILKKSIEINGPTIPVYSTIKNGIIIFPGAGVVKRSWETDNFLALIKLIQQQTSQPVYLAGGPSEIGIGNYLEENLPRGSVVNKIGKTSLPQLIELIGEASLVIANETSAIHIAAATKTNAVCILGGGHFERFAPYPEYIINKPACVYEKLECYYCNWNCKFITKEDEPYPCISVVSLETVWDTVQSFIA
ncbi:MAG: lipopolysaccharide core biosynthesis protein [Mucilaginibacter sp.]|nr:lipopolysaccharide core biosynthesis protein [Mucilaginibacter sp.]